MWPTKCPGRPGERETGLFVYILYTEWRLTQILNEAKREETFKVEIQHVTKFEGKRGYWGCV